MNSHTSWRGSAAVRPTATALQVRPRPRIERSASQKQFSSRQKQFRGRNIFTQHPNKMTPHKNYSKWLLAVVTAFSLSGIADAQQAARRQNYLYFAAIYERNKEIATVKVVIDEVKLMDGKEGVLETQFKDYVHSNFQTSHDTWVIHVIPTSTHAVVYRFTMNNGKTRGIAIGEGQSPEAAEANMQSQARSFARKNVEIVRRWPSQAELDGGQGAQTTGQGAGVNPMAPSEGDPKKPQGLFAKLFGNRNGITKTKPEMTTPVPVEHDEQAVQRNGTNTQIPQGTPASLAPTAPTVPEATQVSAGLSSFKALVGKYSYVSGTFDMGLGAVAFPPFGVEISGTASKPQLTLSEFEVLDLQPTGPGTFNFSEKDEDDAVRGTVTFRDGVLHLERSITVFAAGVTGHYSSMHRK